MVAKHFEIGDLVWAKMKGFPHWPGEISVSKNDKVKKSQHFVYFYGSDNYAWIPDENIKLHNETLVEKYTRDQKRPQTYLNAVERIVLASKGSSKYLKDFQISYEKGDALKDNGGVAKKRDIKRKMPGKKTFGKDSRKQASYRAVDHQHSYEISPKRQKSDNGLKLFRYAVPTFPYSHDGRVTSDDNEVDSVPGILSRNEYKERPASPSIDLNCENTFLSSKGITPTLKKIGFLGLGRIGQGVVRNLLQSGHSVTVWNRTPTKTDKFVVKKGSSREFEGATPAQTPADVIMACDITFCCVSDPDSSKRIVFDNCGVLNGLHNSPPTSEKKGFVEMTSLDPQTSEAISQEVTLKGGRYLEAQISGTRGEARDGKLFILAAGDRSLYDDCSSCFLAMGQNCSFISTDVGVASKYNIMHSMLLGTVYAAVAESLALVERVGLGQSEFLNILQYGNLKTPVVIDKGSSMINKNYISDTPLKHVQQNLCFGLTLGSSVEQPMPIVAAANEIYKHCKLLRYADHDVSAVYEGTKR